MSRCSRPPVLWLGGRGAWFEINPSAAYLPMYRNICEAIRLYYAIYDYYSSRKAKSPKQGSKSIDPIERLSDVFLNVCALALNGHTTLLTSLLVFGQGRERVDGRGGGPKVPRSGPILHQPVSTIKGRGEILARDLLLQMDH